MIRALRELPARLRSSESDFVRGNVGFVHVLPKDMEEAQLFETIQAKAITGDAGVTLAVKNVRALLVSPAFYQTIHIQPEPTPEFRFAMRNFMVRNVRVIIKKFGAQIDVSGASPAGNPRVLRACLAELTERGWYKD